MTTLNGREQVSSGSSRSVEFDQYPADLLSAAVVYKTGDAALFAQGIAGTVDLRTVSPLAQGKRIIAANAFYESLDMDKLNAGSKNDGYRFSGSYIDQFQDNTIGLAIGVSLTLQPGQGEQWNAWGYPDASDGNAVLGGAKPFVRSSELDRDGYMAVLEYRPSKTFSAALDVYYTNFDETQQLRGIELPLYWSSAMLEPGYTVEDGVITRGTFSNVFGVIRNDIAVKKADIYNAGLKLEFGDGNGWDTTLDLSYSFADRAETVLETYSGTGSNQTGAPDTVIYDLSGGTGAVFTTAIDYTDASQLVLTGPQGWGGDVVPGGQLGYLKEPVSEDEIVQARIVTARHLDNYLGLFSRFSTGVNLTQRTKFEREAGKYVAGRGGQTEVAYPGSIGNTDLSFIGIPGMASYNPIQVLNSGVYDLLINPNADVQAADWNVDETITTGYAQFEIDTMAGDFPITGNIGVQIIHADQTATGTAAGRDLNGDIIPLNVSGGTDYIDFVPSLNLKMQLNDNSFLRFGAARQVNRQPMNDMRAGNQYGINETDGEFSIATSGGNPELEPWRTNAVDLSFEHYLDNDVGYFSVTAFYKDLVSYTYDETGVFDFTGYPIGDLNPIGTITQPENGAGGFMKGIELTTSLSGELISEALKGFGLIATISFVDSSISPDLNNRDVPLPGLSDTVSSVTLYYEANGFAARISNRSRSEFRGDINTFGPRSEDFRTISEESVWDAQISYAFAEGTSLEGVSVILQGYNLTDEPLSAYEGNNQRLVRDYQRYGTSYLLGVSYKY